MKSEKNVVQLIKSFGHSFNDEEKSLFSFREKPGSYYYYYLVSIII